MESDGEFQRLWNGFPGLEEREKRERARNCISWLGVCIAKGVMYHGVMLACSGPGDEFSGLLRLVRMELRVEGASWHVFFACAATQGRETEGRKDGRTLLS